MDSKHFRYALPSLVTVPVHLPVQPNIPEPMKIKWAAASQPVRGMALCVNSFSRALIHFLPELTFEAWSYFWISRVCKVTPLRVLRPQLQKTCELQLLCFCWSWLQHHAHVSLFSVVDKHTQICPSLSDILRTTPSEHKEPKPCFVMNVPEIMWHFVHVNTTATDNTPSCIRWSSKKKISLFFFLEVLAISVSPDVYLSLLICSSPPSPLPKLMGPHQWVSWGDSLGLPSLYLLTLTHQLPHCGNKLFLRAHPALAEVPSGVVHSLLKTENHILRGRAAGLEGEKYTPSLGIFFSIEGWSNPCEEIGEFPPSSPHRSTQAEAELLREVQF